ncbi:MAG: adenylyl-sulfate kinase [Candidatus Omnitrophica bacterium]|jgi:adenylylsulfate kinase|nr:adenylyl-sulfate kinase [Candidatus Omnitrophota bacterium]MDD3274747.1 adenylyl-sulfate kinase [Candidatus Omnitrophota bacterium]MDD5078362.1 adenylyl-sulfate kinase [Candidatus Omnitrophota bacterium]MDD5725342.1 adenylyl-sulfate kinase [Candidatus Omnitrophota bacterium]
MYNGHKKYALFIGRWQPFHKGHKYLIDEALAKGENVCVAIRDTEISEHNPYGVEQRAEMIRRVYGSQVEIIAIPDISSINIGRKVGYDVNRIDPPAEIEKISGTNVRAGKDGNVPPEVAEYITSLRTTLWLTGLPCSGKTTLSKRLKAELDNRGFKTVCLDADDLRSKLNADLGFSKEDRAENLRRAAHIAKLFNDNGNFVIACFVSPLEENRRLVREVIGNFKLVFVKCGLEICEKRDVKGMYKKAREGQIPDFTGVSAPFEEPSGADIVVDTEHLDVEECVRRILEGIGAHKVRKYHHCLAGSR